MEKLISVILTVYNQEKHISECLDSILTQTYQNFELVIVDDGSKDRSPEIIQRYAEKDHRIKVIYQSNAGRAAATDTAVNNANGKFLAIIDPDDVMLPNRLEKQVALHLSNPQIHATSSYQICMSEQGHVYGEQHYPGPFSVKECRKAAHNKDVILVPITGLTVSKEAFIEVGGLRDEFFPVEDLEFFNRFIDKGFNLVVIPEPLVKYREHTSSISQKKPLLQYQMAEWARHCMMLRRSGRKEITFDRFLEMRDKEPAWMKLKRKKFWYCSMLCKRSRLALMDKNYARFIWNLMAASVLSPNIVFNKLKGSTIRK
jgi:glycosyltransferase involved in cell wall biosynthesis